MSYVNQGIDQRAEVLWGADVGAAENGKLDSLEYWLKGNAGPVTPDPASAYVTILDPSGAQRVARTAATISSTNKLSYTRSWDLASGFNLWEDYVAIWEWTESTVAKLDRQFFDVVRTKLPCLIDTNNLLELYPNLVEHLGSINETDATKFIRRAWSHLLDRIRVGHNRPSLILEKARLVNPAIHLSLSFIANALAKNAGDLWDERRLQHHKTFESLLGGLGDMKYDRDEDGLAAESDKKRINRRTFNV